MKTTVAQFIPILLIVLLLTSSKTFVNLSYSILGKVIALLIIVFYTHLDKYVGLIICLLVIIYYQSDFVENMLNTDEIMNEMVENFESAKLINPKAKELKHTVEEIQEGDKKVSQLQENMSNLNEVYNISNKEEKEEVKEGFTVNDFRDENCSENQLLYKNMDVRNDMTTHIFPNVKYNNDECNVCDNTCDFSIVEDKLKNEKELFAKFSRDENPKEKA